MSPSGYDHLIRFLSKKFDGVQARFDGIEGRLDRMEDRLTGAEAGLTGVGDRLIPVEISLGAHRHEFGALVELARDAPQPAGPARTVSGSRAA